MAHKQLSAFGEYVAEILPKYVQQVQVIFTTGVWIWIKKEPCSQGMWEWAAWNQKYRLLHPNLVFSLCLKPGDSN